MQENGWYSNSTRYSGRLFYRHRFCSAWKSLAAFHAAILLLSGSPAAHAETLYEALAAAYESNPALDAERARQQADEENIRQAIAGWLPTISLDANRGSKRRQTEPPLIETHLNPEGLGLTLEQPLFTGFKTLHGKRKAQAEVRAGQFQLDDKEQSVLLEAVTAYAGVLRDRQINVLQKNNIRYLQKEFTASRARHKAGDLSKTDVSQAKARLYEGRASQAQAQADEAASVARYIAVIGSPPGNLAKPVIPERLIPRSFEEALALADSENPTIESARQREAAARREKLQAYGDLLPSLSLEVKYNQDYGALRTIDREEESSIFLRMKVPLYQGGSTRSKIRQSRARETSRRYQVSDTRRQTRAAVTAAWQQVKAAKLRITSARLQVRAAREALKGVKIESNVGERDFIDVLNAQREFVNAEISLARAEHDLYVAKYTLLTTVGRLRARLLDLHARDRLDPLPEEDISLHLQKNMPLRKVSILKPRTWNMFRGGYDPYTEQNK